MDWRQALLPASAALVVSVPSLLYRYRHSGRPFSSWRTGLLSLTVIIAAAIAVTLLGLFLPRIPPVSADVLIPALLCAPQLGKGERELHVVEHSQVFAVLTLGFTVLLGMLGLLAASGHRRPNRSTASEDKLASVA